MNDNAYYIAKWKLAVLENIATLTAIVACVAAVAYFAQTAWGLLAIPLIGGNINGWGSRSCDCETEEEDETKERIGQRDD